MLREEWSLISVAHFQIFFFKNAASERGAGRGGLKLNSQIVKKKGSLPHLQIYVFQWMPLK